MSFLNYILIPHADNFYREPTKFDQFLLKLECDANIFCTFLIQKWPILQQRYITIVGGHHFLYAIIYVRHDQTINQLEKHSALKKTIEEPGWYDLSSRGNKILLFVFLVNFDFWDIFLSVCIKIHCWLQFPPFWSKKFT